MALGVDDRNLMLSNPRKKKGLTGGSAKAGQSTAGKEGWFGGIGFGNANAFKTQAEVDKKNAPSYEEAYNVTGGSSGLAGYDTRMTESEKETYRTTKMKIAATKVDDYSDWGKKRKAAADTAHAEGKKSQQDVKDQRVIDARDSSRYDWDVIRPQQAKEAEVRMQQALSKKWLGNTYGSKQMRGRSDKQLPGSGRGTTRGVKKGSGINLKAPNSPGSKWKGNRPWEVGVTKAGISALTKDGWTPEEAAEYGDRWLGGKAFATQTALPGVFQGSPSAAALYGGTGTSSAAANAMVAGSTVMDKKTREGRYGQGLGSIKIRNILATGSGGQ